MNRIMKNRKFIAILLCIAMMFTIMPMSYASDITSGSGLGYEQNNGSGDELFGDGSGEEENPPADNQQPPQEPADEETNTPADTESQEGAEGEDTYTHIEGCSDECTVEGCACSCHEAEDEELQEEADNNIGKTVKFNSGLVKLYFYADVNSEHSIAIPVPSILLPKTAVISNQFIDEDGVIWYQLYSEEWPEKLNGYCYVTEDSVTIVEEPIVELVDEETGVEVAGDLPEGITLSVTPLNYANDLTGDDGEETNTIAIFDITLYDENGEEWQPAEGKELTITMDAYALGLEDGDEVEILHEHNDEVSSLGNYIIADGLLTFKTTGFSIYAVIGNYGDNWNCNNYQITMTVGDSLNVRTSINDYRYSYSWTTSGDTSAITISNRNSRTVSVTANSAGEIELQCVITSSSGTETEKVTVVALDKTSDMDNYVDNDIIFANIDKAYISGDTEYENTYGPYVMKIRFEDPDGNVLKYKDGTTVGEDYYVFDSDVNIDINTFAANAPDGYTYTGSYFFWSGHFDGDKAYVTKVERDNDNTAYGSHLWFSGTHTQSGAGRWTYQASGVLHIVYAPVEETHTIAFNDHCGYELATYGLVYNDNNQGVKFPEKYITNIDNMATNLIPNHHNTHDPGCEFTGKWVVTGGGSGIDKTYTTSELKKEIKNWDITSNIIITAQCSETNVTIDYKVASGVGSVSPTSETILAGSGTAQGSTATPGAGYTFVGWYSDRACTTQVGSSAEFIPQPVNGKYVSATYYAKFVEQDVRINYAVVGPTGCGTVNPESETIKAFSGTAQGSTATPGAGYTFVGWYSDRACTTQVGSSAEFIPQPVNGKYVSATYYAKFVEQDVRINYAVVGPTGCGTVSPESETVKILTGTASGSTAAASSELYRFVGWYSDAECINQISKNAKYVPQKDTTGKNVATTYYAKFERALVDLTIRKTVDKTFSGDNFKFVFSIKGDATDEHTKNIDMKVAVAAGGSVTIKNLPAGKYTVTEINSGWRYNAAASQTQNIVTNTTLEFHNTTQNNKWLSWASSVENFFTTIAGGRK